jgi:hypothetical protein
MERHRGAALRIGDVHIAHRGRYDAMPQDALHLRQVHARLQQIAAKTRYRNGTRSNAGTLSTGP